MDYGDAGYEDYTTTSWREGGNAYISDKAGNEYPVTLKSWSSDAGSYANAVTNYKCKIQLGPETYYEKEDYTGFLSSHMCDSNLYHDIINGVYLEDYLAKRGDYEWNIEGPEKDKFIALAKQGDKNAISAKQKKEDRAEAKYKALANRYDYIDGEYGTTLKIEDGKIKLNRVEIEKGPIFEILNNAISGVGLNINDFNGARLKFTTSAWKDFRIYFDNTTQGISYIDHTKKDHSKIDYKNAVPVDITIKEIDISKCAASEKLEDIIKAYEKKYKEEIRNIRDKERKRVSDDKYYGNNEYDWYRGDRSITRAKANELAKDIVGNDFYKSSIPWENFIDICEFISGKPKDDDATVEITPKETVGSTEIKNASYDEEDISKCEKWHETGRRNIKSMDNSKLKRTAKCCKDLGFEEEYNKCIEELKSRGFNLSESLNIVEQFLRESGFSNYSIKGKSSSGGNTCYGVIGHGDLRNYGASNIDFYHAYLIDCIKDNLKDLTFRKQSGPSPLVDMDLTEISVAKDPTPKQPCKLRDLRVKVYLKRKFDLLPEERAVIKARIMQAIKGGIADWNDKFRNDHLTIKNAEHLYKRFKYGEDEKSMDFHFELTLEDYKGDTEKPKKVFIVHKKNRDNQ